MPEQKVAKLAALEVPCSECGGTGLCNVPSDVSPDGLAMCKACSGTAAMLKYPGLWEECPGVPSVGMVDPPPDRNALYVQIVTEHDHTCCDGSGKRLVNPRLAAMVLLSEFPEHNGVIHTTRGWITMELLLGPSPFEPPLAPWPSPWQAVLNAAVEMLEVE